MPKRANIFKKVDKNPDKTTVLATQCPICFEIIYIRTVFDNISCHCKTTSFNGKIVDYSSPHIKDAGVMEDFIEQNIFRMVIPYTDNALKSDERTNRNNLGHIPLSFNYISPNNKKK